MSLTSLNYDILSNICSFFKTRRSLLGLALTCRTLHSAIIPAFLYEKLDFPHRLDNPASLGRFQSFIDAIHAADSMAADAVRHVEIRGVESLRSLWPGFIPLMRNLRSVAIPRWYTPFPPPTLKQLTVMPHLHTLLLDDWHDDVSMDPLRGLHGLQSLSVHLTDFLEISVDSALGEILLNSRGTLRELSLYNVEWQLPTRSANLGVLIWPKVVSLCMGGNSEVIFSINIHLAHHFPSVCYFDCSLVHWDHPRDVPFAAKLFSLDADLGLFKFAKDAGAPLRRAVIYVADDNVALNSYLSTDILSIRFHYITLQQLEQLAAVCPDVAYLAVVSRLGYSGSTSPSHASSKERILRSLSMLTIECLSLSWPIGEDLIHHGDRYSLMEGFAESAFQVIPSLRFIALCSIYNHTTYWRRAVGLDITSRGFSQVLDEEGPDYLDYYDWRWRDRPQYDVDGTINDA
ncbi:hypothetical protein BOTBODRAFT_28230 [Botryobasidium botryosum FD-172 SS1]|uniref:F-box domain-containing protein n=1 Tax=Botryobasidium botryosum (strain FD-172 SS1) TaxID=930990 RepID=A0A067N695_BOTB1|nr:hypothetical protein BOTBODRAFT_28230 [Botryobasidium botryosum FD-172 SS1]